MFPSRSYSFESPHRPVRGDNQWALMNQQMALEQEKANRYQFELQKQKRRRLKHFLDEQVADKSRVKSQQKHQDDWYGQRVKGNAETYKQEQEAARQLQRQKRRVMEQVNKHMMSEIAESKIREKSDPGLNNMDIGYGSQLARAGRLAQERKGMVEELDRQVMRKEEEKAKLKREEQLQNMNNREEQYKRHQLREEQLRRNKRYGQNDRIYREYQAIAQQQQERIKQYDSRQIDEAARRKREEQAEKALQKDMNQKMLNDRMRAVLDEQVAINQRKKQLDKEWQKNPTGSIGGALRSGEGNRGQMSERQRYYEDLARQVQEKKRKKEEEKVMTEEEYKLNLNQLNKAVDGKFARDSYIDRSIGALSQNRQVNVSLIDSHVDRPQASAVRDKLYQIRANEAGRHQFNHKDRGISHF